MDTRSSLSANQICWTRCVPHLVAQPPTALMTCFHRFSRQPFFYSMMWECNGEPSGYKKQWGSSSRIVLSRACRLCWLLQSDRHLMCSLISNSISRFATYRWRVWLITGFFRGVCLEKQEKNWGLMVEEGFEARQRTTSSAHSNARSSHPTRNRGRSGKRTGSDLPDG